MITQYPSSIHLLLKYTFSPPAHLRAVTYISQISLHVTLSNQNIVACGVKQPLLLTHPVKAILRL